MKRSESLEKTLKLTKKQAMIEQEFSEEDLRRHVKHEVHLEVSFKDMKPTKLESLDDATFHGGFKTNPWSRS